MKRKLHDIVRLRVDKHLQDRHDQKDHGHRGFSFADEVKNALSGVPMSTDNAYKYWQQDLTKAVERSWLPELAELWSQGFSDTIRGKLDSATVTTMDTLTNDQNSRASTIVPEKELTDALKEITTESFYNDRSNPTRRFIELSSDFMTPVKQAMQVINSLLVKTGHPAGILHGLQLSDFRGVDKTHNDVYDSRGLDRSELEPSVIFDDINFSDLSASIGNHVIMYYRDNPEDVPDKFKNAIVE